MPVTPRDCLTRLDLPRSDLMGLNRTCNPRSPNGLFVLLTEKSSVRVTSDPLSVQLCSMCHTNEAGVQWISAEPGPV